MIQEDVRFMNEEEEGLQQAPHWQRPITVDFLERNWTFVKRRQFCRKLRYGDELHEAAIAIGWAAANRDLVNQSESSYWRLQDVNESFYGPFIESIKEHTKTFKSLKAEVTCPK